jgi:transposase
VAAAAPAGVGAQQKRLVAAERAESARAAWRAAAAALDPARLVFCAETRTHTALTRRRARAPRGERAGGAGPRNHGPNGTLLAVLPPTGIGPTVVIDGATERLAFAAFGAQVLVPSLRPGQVVVRDNLRAHKSARARQLIEGAGCQLLFLPASSPDLNPIALACANLKTHLRRVAARAFAAWVAAIGDAIDAVTPTAARGFSAHGGVPFPDQQL